MAGGKLRSRGERSNRGAEGKGETFLHRGSVLTSTHQPEAGLLTRWGRRGLGAEAQASVRSQGEDWGWLRDQEGVREKSWTCLRGKRPLFQGARGEGIQSTA